MDAREKDENDSSDSEETDEFDEAPKVMDEFPPMDDIPDRSTIGGGASATPSPMAQLDARISRGDLRRRQDADDPEGERNQEDEPDMRIPEGIRIPTPPDMVSSGSRRWSLKSSLSFKGSKGIEKSRGTSNPAGASRLQSSAAGKGNRHNTLTANTPRKAISHGSSTTRMQLWADEWTKSLEPSKGKRNKLHDEQYRSLFHELCVIIVRSDGFDRIIMFAILVNAILIAVQAEHENPTAISDMINIDFTTIDVIFLCLYLFEFLIKFYADPREYVSSNYNRFDAIILAVSIIQMIQTNINIDASDTAYLKVLRALRALRALRSVSFIHTLQVIVNALVKTLGTIGNIVMLLVMLMYVFAIMGYYLFGQRDSGAADEYYWGNLGAAFLTLFVYVTADGWTAVIDSAGVNGVDYTSMCIFSVVWIFIGNFIITNLFIGVIVQNLDEATEEERVQREKEKSKRFSRRKSAILARQDEDLQRFLHSRKITTADNLRVVMNEIAQTLRHEELVPMTHASTHLPWLETFLSTMAVQETTMYRTQQLHFEMARTVAKLAETKFSTYMDTKFDGVD